jgi:putative transposase
LVLWAYQRSVTLDFSRPEKPIDDAFIELFNVPNRMPECTFVHEPRRRAAKMRGLA